MAMRSMFSLVSFILSSLHEMSKSIRAKRSFRQRHGKMYSLHHAQPSHGLIVSKARTANAGFCFVRDVSDNIAKKEPGDRWLVDFRAPFFTFGRMFLATEVFSCPTGHSLLPTRQGET